MSSKNIFRTRRVFFSTVLLFTAVANLTSLELDANPKPSSFQLSRQQLNQCPLSMRLVNYKNTELSKLYYQQARKAYNLGDIESAVQCTELAILSDPNSWLKELRRQFRNPEQLEDGQDSYNRGRNSLKSRDLASAVKELSNAEEKFREAGGPTGNTCREEVHALLVQARRNNFSAVTKPPNSDCLPLSKEQTQ